MGELYFNITWDSSPPPPLLPSLPTPSTSWEKTNSLLNSAPPSNLPNNPRPEEMETPPLPRPLPSRTSKKLLPLESSRDSMTDNHSLRSPKDEGHRGYAAIDQRYGEKTRYHAIRRASPRERHQDPPKGRRCQRYGQEMSFLKAFPLVTKS